MFQALVMLSLHTTLVYMRVIFFTYDSCCIVSGVDPTKKCHIDGNHAQVELPKSGTLTEHDEDEKEFRFCFDSACNQFKVIKVLWCPPKVHNQKPFYIYKLKPTKPGMAYCV